MQIQRRRNSLLTWALHPYGEFSGSRLKKGILWLSLGIFAGFVVCESFATDDAITHDTAELQKAANDDGFAVLDRTRIKDGHATVALQFGRCVFEDTAVTVSADGDITGYDILLGGTDTYHRNTANAPHFARITTSRDMPVMTTINENGQTVPCAIK